MSTPSAASQPDPLSSIDFREHDATRGVVTSALFGATLWCLMIGVLSWTLA
jgi:hypothetical protein